MTERGKRIHWTPEMDALIGKMPDSEVAKKLGFSNTTIHHRRLRLGVPRYGAEELARTVVLGVETMGKIEAIKPLLLAQINERGVPLRDLEPWQVVEIAINQLHQGLKRSNVRSLYQAK